MDAELTKISIVVPLLNERDNVRELLERIRQAMAPSGWEYELVLVDDGSTDGTPQLCAELSRGRPEVKIVELRRNFGQTAALAAGFDHSSGQVIVPLDGDLQNDPADIPHLVTRLQEGYDVVSGWRRRRQDKLLTRKVPSWVANFLIGWITKVRLHDYGCTLKAYRRDVVDHLRLYGEMHRFIPALASWSGARVTEMEVGHHPRTRGRTKYGLNRTIKVVFDLITVKFLGTFSTKPLHIFGGIGLFTFFMGFLSGLCVIYQKYISPTHLAMNRNPLLVLTAMLMPMSVMFLLMGLLAEMMCRTYHESQNKPTYVIRSIRQPGRESPPDDSQAPKGATDVKS
ncbi:MAG: glycosyltransferase family 2 protein [Sedimentisphaerales bacterium]|nr:glycosyltransferase family 2 protein [Sedimentisphaerales bacterium]